MNDILMTNIFFMITAISSIVLTVILSIILLYVVRLIKKINHITDVVGDETVKIIGDIDHVRSSVKEHMGVVKTAAGAAVIKKIVDKIFTKK